MKKYYEAPIVDIVKYEIPDNVLLTVSSTNNLTSSTGTSLADLIQLHK